MSNKQSSNRVLMVRPANFGFNPETAENNAFQEEAAPEDRLKIAKAAEKEFDEAVLKLRNHGIKVTVWQDAAQPVKTDAVFPNNWFSTHADGTLLLYPMFSPNRRLERDEALLDQLKRDYVVDRDYTMTHYEEEELYLEGTGSIVIDHMNNIAYACRSTRTDMSLMDKWCVVTNNRSVTFDAVDANNVPIYHTNVMMAIGTKVAIICLDTITNQEERTRVEQSLSASGKEIVAISIDQMNHFAGNMIEVVGDMGMLYMVCSQTAFDALTEAQRSTINKSAQLLPISVNTIEKYGGGSARCMIAELFLRVKGKNL